MGGLRVQMLGGMVLAMARILVVDDFKDGRDVMALILRHAGHEPALAGGGEEAVRLLRDQTFDLVLLDVSMPLINGFDVLRMLRDESIKHPPIVMMTAHNDDLTVERARSMGASGYIIKGDVDVDGVLNRIEKHLDGAA